MTAPSVNSFKASIDREDQVSTPHQYHDDNQTRYIVVYHFFDHFMVIFTT